jgi:hypothetical protein
MPARPSDGRVSQQHGDKANGVAAARACVLWRSLHARGDAYAREEGHVTSATLVSALSLRNRCLRDQATGESASSTATRQTGWRQRGHACSDAQDGDKAN